ncbi:MAG: hypothetical protein M3416_05975, partial [Acidobacteriota bacterium]|nr:hypothetical protein [Acidobacteriota bacterium]
PPKSLPLVSRSAKTVCAIPGADAWQHLTEVAPEGWMNRITLRSLLLCSQTDCSELLRRAAVPVCVIGVRGDARALEESELPQTADRVLFEGGHFELYGRLLPRAAKAAARFFRRQLLSGR